MKTQTESELQEWVSVFSLEREYLEDAFTQYARLLDELEGRNLSDGEVAMSLAQLRKNVRNSARDEEHAPQMANQIDEITERLKRALDNTQILQEDEASIDVGPLAARLEAAHTMFMTLRAALARRTR